MCLERYFILDYDAVVDISGSNDKFLQVFYLKELESEFRREGVTVLETRGIFVWTRPASASDKPNQKGGTIENAMIDLVNKSGIRLKSLFIDSNAALSWDGEKGIRRKLVQGQETYRRKY